jgi:large subunit ribosomal protein L5|tara:strand:+ start:2687 stop:3229 length:543 start_codon:yes stop_codon:yes gene_type:complete
MSPRLKEKYNKEVRPSLKKEGGYANIMMVPTLTKIVVNTCIKEAITNPKLLTAAANEMALITGQKADIRKARRSIANFKLREGMPLGVRTTLRGARMWYFLERLNDIAIPRIRDFRGLNPKGFDGRGNYSMGLTEQLLFPEIEYDQIVKVNGMNISFVTTANTDAEGRELLKKLGLPFRS